ncbi:hypothetical protein QYG89_00570 [Bacillus sp. B190/17]|uniref:ATP-dependent DNA helicase n=1 Tax=Bacillus lumedeiriae TaxID=3058829 RepID=A0ABW8I580_9BACI
MRKIIAVIICLLFIFPMYADASVVHLNLKADEFALSFLPLTDGEAAILHTADGRHYLINTGYKGTGAEIFRYMNQFQIRTLDGLIITEKKYWQEPIIHQLVKKRKLKKVISGLPMQGTFQEDGLIYEEWKEGDLRKLGPGVHLVVLYSGLKKGEGLDFSIKHYDSRFLWMSSASPSAEKKMFTHSLKDSNIVKIPMFGKRGSISYSLLTHIDPQTAVLFKQKKRHPDGELMEMLHQMWIDIYYTEQHGLFTIKFTKEGYEIFSVPYLK